MMKYIPQGPKDREALLSAMGLKSEDELFKFIPDQLKVRGALKYPKAQSEIEIRRSYQALTQLSKLPDTNFAGCGIYSHDIPSIVPFIQSRSEFSTSYTPYQPEISQGTLQAIFEFQTLVCQMTECELSNSSLYDGATALAEAVLMALRIKKKTAGKILLSGALHPNYRQVLDTYLHDFKERVEELPLDGDRLNLKELKSRLGSADVLVTQSPNIFGVLEAEDEIGSLVKSSEALWATSTMEPFAWGLIRGAGAHGAHFVTAEGQAFGSSPNLGGASYGIFATRSEYLRQLPGRLVGETLDEKGRRSYTLTFATREQFIRREKATSNICTNQNLNMLAGLIHLATLGKSGIKSVALRSHSQSEYLKSALKPLKNLEISTSPTFNEFVATCSRPASELVSAAAKDSWVCGVDLGRFRKEWKHKLLICTTELNSKRDLEKLADFLKAKA